MSPFLMHTNGCNFWNAIYSLEIRELKCHISLCRRIINANIFTSVICRITLMMQLEKFQPPPKKWDYRYNLIFHLILSKYFPYFRHPFSFVFFFNFLDFIFRSILISIILFLWGSQLNKLLNEFPHLNVILNYFKNENWQACINYTEDKKECRT